MTHLESTFADANRKADRAIAASQRALEAAERYQAARDKADAAWAKYLANRGELAHS